MSEEQTDRLEGGTPFEIRVLREFANINQHFNILETRFDSFEVRLTNLEERVEARLRDTRPIWEAVLSRLDSIEARLDRMETRLDGVEAGLKKVSTKFDVVASELLDVRSDERDLQKSPPAA